MEDAVKQLVEKYNHGSLSAGEEATLERYLAEGIVELDDLQDVSQMQQQINEFPVPEPSAEMSHGFYSLLAEKKKASEKKGIVEWFSSLWAHQPTYQWAYTFVILVVGVLGGYFLKPTENGGDEIKELSAEVSEMKEMMMLSLIEKESTSDRLRAVNLTSEMQDVSSKVTEALFKTLNTDPNDNVRLATIEALYPYAGNPEVRKGLVQSISKQESPLVQVTLAELMVALQEKSSVEELEQLLDKENTPAEVKDRIKESIKVLI
ncbi:HEAT repeat domain-containing protein [Fulvivirga sp. RKSG066]|uniref:HEAT repeat domain-containing protein n=1 Tax=Fulvivirga aurantia TaxID=2529383 RepID=UPI0012BB8A86|nr:HEAT repeat domain-containing protein [Fulvivirga aurantia]MTI20281.1 HEAT repeat domain-containing protein [Fulvivirga aurantia]